MTDWRISGFTEMKRLGAGAQGHVALARHDASGALVAVKYLPAGASEEERARMRHEARMLAQVDSPHVARLYRMVEGDGGAAIVMEAIDGVSLKELLERTGALGPEASLAVLKGSLLGLAAAHAVGVVHRDFKPANVMVPADGGSRLVDFGIAVPAGQASGGAGTPFYMAPEQWTRRTATPATDVYAATCVFVECVSGSRPYRGDLAALQSAHLTAPVPAEAVPEPLRPLVERGMAKDPAGRPAGAAAFVAELESVAAGAYGADWEQRGVRALAVSAAALAALFPLGALLTAPGAGVAAGAGSAGGGLLATATGKVVAGAAVAALVAGGAVAVRQAAGDEERPRPRPSASAALVAAVTQCKVTDSSDRDATPKGRPQPVRLPAQVRLPVGAAVYRFGPDIHLIGEAGAACRELASNGGGFSQIGREGAGSVYRTFPFTNGGIKGELCRLFPASPWTRKAAPNPADCDVDPIQYRQDLQTGVPGLEGMLAAAGAYNEKPPPSPYASVTLGLVGKNGVPSEVNCTMPWAKAAICTAALTYWFAEATREDGIGPADLDRVARRIADVVAASRR
ncbi:serine/threonine-protein kinase [Actinomadura macrotermitis]|uniref:non-specific serine/threonine protein kinase n=1 Tax=Actinomadura macrotermitis TaxID=2585200 RepID=A0A7K0BXV8_9ACTN|nr:serine/threonine-protein kinase [Actinomadura macrotermitis]MQY06021.1 Serine/threonine-protein kinase PknD [Actinomadura macrotermitis]